MNFKILHIKGRNNLVADTLSRVTGSEFLTESELCSMYYILGVIHRQDLPYNIFADMAADVATDQPAFLNGILSVYERGILRDKLLEE